MQQVLDMLSFEPSGGFGDPLRGPCPVHGSSSPRSRSFSVNVAQQRYYCHKCKSHGNQLELYAAANAISVYQAAIKLCEALGREVPWIERW